MNRVIEAQKFSFNNKEDLQKDKRCGCFYCLKIFDPAEIKNWINDGNGTAVCPYCGVDSVLGEYTGFPITAEFLQEMKEHWL